MMSTRDYVVISDSLRVASYTVGVNEVLEVARIMSKAFKEDNPNFDKDKFVSAVMWGRNRETA